MQKSFQERKYPSNRDHAAVADTGLMRFAARGSTFVLHEGGINMVHRQRQADVTSDVRAFLQG
jgi:hypothetical protein